MSDELESGLEQARALRGFLVLAAGGDELRLRKLKLHPAEDWCERWLPALPKLAGQLNAEVEDEAEGVRMVRAFAESFLEAFADYDREAAVGDAAAWGELLYPEEILPIFLAMRDSALPFVGLLADHRALLPAAAPTSPSSTNGRSRTGASIPIASARRSTPGS